MIVEPVVRGNICVTAHPEGCAAEVQRQVAHSSRSGVHAGPKRALVIGCSRGMGLASTISATIGAGAASVGICYERNGSVDRCATAGWYNMATLEEEVRSRGGYLQTLVGDAFSEQTKSDAIEALSHGVGPVDLVVYSVAAKRRRAPSGAWSLSSLKSIGEPFTAKGVDLGTREVREMILPAATPEEIAGTIAVMGGSDWAEWIAALEEANLLAPGATTLAYSYVGAERLSRAYRNGTIGQAKRHLEETARDLDARLKTRGGTARVAVMKAMVTESSLALPMSTLYTMCLFKVMKQMGIHEGPIEQVDRLFRDKLHGGSPSHLDEEGRIRMDELELMPSVQREVQWRLDAVSTDTLSDMGDVDGFYTDWLRIYGFGVPDVDYRRDVDPVRALSAEFASLEG